MINYKIGDLVTRINTMYSKFSGALHYSFLRNPEGAGLEFKATSVPYLAPTGLNAEQKAYKNLIQTNQEYGNPVTKVPYTKDNYQIINLLIKLGILINPDCSSFCSVGTTFRSKTKQQILTDSAKISSKMASIEPEGLDYKNQQS
jgi:hypothetical protein